MVVLAAAAWGSAAHGADLGFHAVDTVNQNHCRQCHDTAQGEPRLRGWAAPLPTAPGDWVGRRISALCYQCHESGGGGLVPPAHDMTNNAFASTSHGFVFGDVPREPEGSPQGSYYPAVSDSTLPYADFTELECTSCHSVHRSTDRPFLHRATIADLCDECHRGRDNGGSADTIDGFTRQYSTHPTGQLLNDTARARIKDVAAIDAALKTPTPVGVAWSLGGHLGDPAGNTGLIECQTCHAIHGPALSTPGLPKLLAIDNVTPSGTATPSNLCEGCHYGGNAGEQVGSAVTQAGLPPGEWSDHPIDANANRSSTYPTGVALPLAWLEATTPNRDGGAQPFYQGVTQAPVCSSCHDTHGGIAGTPLLRGPQPGAAWAPLDYDSWCFSCHTLGQLLPAAHHSTSGNLAIAQGDTFDSLLSCGDCHGPAGTTEWRAHNGFWAWPVAAAYSSISGAFCMACHSGGDPADLVAPALKGQSFAEPASFPATHGTVRGTGSHYLGPDSGEFAGVAPKVSPWSSGYFSSYGFPSIGGGGLVAPGAPGEIICQSCHHILYNDGKAGPARYGDGSTEKAGWRSNLLLEPYEDDPPGNAAGAGAGAVGSALCTGCHDPAVGIHHPITSYPPLVPLSGLALRTGPGSFADQASAPSGAGAAPGTLSYPDVDKTDCDSCHRPHRADSDSDVAAAAHGDKTSSPWDNRPTRHILEVDGALHVYSGLCDECHAR